MVSTKKYDNVEVLITDSLEKEEDIINQDVTKIQTDGSAKINANKKMVAGQGIFYGDEDPRNKSKRLPAWKQSNNCAEMYAVSNAVQEVVENHKDMKKRHTYVIHTDSL